MALPDQLTGTDMTFLEEQYHYGVNDSNEAGFQLDDIIDAPIAVVTDIAVSMANSIPFADIDLDTADVLSSMGAEDVADFYENNRTLVNVLSFVGSLVIPGLLVGKTLSLARAGKYSFLTGGKLVGSRINKISGAKQLRKDEALGLIKGSGFYTKEYKRARRAWVGAALKDGFMEGAAFEAAFVGMFNGHPFMDDYDTTDFIIGTAFGAVFVPFRFIVDNRKYKLAAAEVEAKIAESAQVGVYPTHMGITGTRGDHLTARVHNEKSIGEEIEATDWADNPGGFDAAQRNQRENAAKANDIAIGMMDDEVKAANKAQREVPAGEENDLYKMGPLGHILKTIRKNVASLNGARVFKFFNTESSLGRAATRVSDINYNFVEDPSALRGSPDFAVETLADGTTDSIYNMLTGRQAVSDQRVFVKDAAGKKVKPSELLGHEDWREVGTVSVSKQLADDGIQFTLKRDVGSMELHIYDDAVKFNDASFADQKSIGHALLKEVLQESRQAVGDQPFKIVIHHQGKRPSQASKLPGLFQARRGLSEEAAQLQTSAMPASLTEDMLHGTRSPSLREIFVPIGAKEGRPIVSGKGYRDMADMPDGHGDFAVVELGEDAKIATFADQRAMAADAEAAGINVLENSQRTRNWLEKRGFVGREVVGGAKRRSKAPAVEWFGGAKAIVKRRLAGDVKEAAAQQRKAHGIADDFDEAAVLDPYTQTIIPASVARSMQRAADIEGGYRVNKSYSMQGETTREFDPFTMSSADVDAQYLDALHAVNRDKPKLVIIDHDDLPRLNAAHISGLGDQGQKVRIRQADGTILTVRHKDELAKALWKGKSDWSLRLQESGYGMQQTSVYTNTPAKGVEMLVGSGHRIDDVLASIDNTADLVTYNAVDKDRLGEFLNAKQLLIEGDPLVNQNLRRNQQWSRQDAQTAIDLHNNVVGEVSAQQASKVPLIGQLYNLVDRGEYRSMIKHVASFFSREILGTPSINSLDFALRKLDELVDGENLGQFVVQTGQDFLRHVNETINPVIDSITGSFNTIAKDQAAQIQFNDIYKSIQKLQKNEQRFVFFDEESGQFITGQDKQGRATSHLRYVRDNQFAEETITINNENLRKFFIDDWPPIQEMLYEMQNTNRKLAGMGSATPLGIWFPYNNISEQNIAYIFNKADNTDKARLIVGKTPAELQSQIRAIQKELEPGQEIVQRADTELWNRITGYAQLNDLERADSGLQRSGILVEGTPADQRIMQDIYEGIKGDIWKHSRQYMRTAGSELFDQLDQYTKWHKVPQVSNAGTFSQKASTKISTSEVVAKTLLHQDMLADNQMLQSVNNVYSHMIEWSLDKVNQTWDGVLKKNGTTVSPDDWIRLQDSLAEQNIPNPYKGWEDFVRQNPDYQGTDAKHFIARANSLLVTLNLRLMELSHAAITTFTIPVVIAAELAARDMPMRYMMGAAKKMLTTNKKDGGIRQIADEKGYSKGRIAEEVSKLMRTALEKPSLLTKAKESKLVDMLSKPSDFAEDTAREMAYLTGYEVAIQKYGVHAETSLLETFANQFTNRTMGNYTSRQRPTMFQGSWGATIGLYQTFMLSMGQQMFRFLERTGDAATGAASRRAFMTLVGAQSGMFGMSSLPFFDPMNRAIGAYVAEDQNDVVSVTYELFGSEDGNSRSMAEYILYGLPSTLMQGAFYTRGQLQPRPPFDPAAPFTEGEVSISPPLINTIKQMWDFAWDTGNQMALALQDGAPVDAARAIAEGISVQSVWRPGARMAELITGSSFDRAGRIVDANTEAAMNWASFARVMGSRPLKEQVLRNLNFTGRYYDAKDQRNRRESIQAFRSAVASNDFARYGSIMQGYMDNGGSMEGWTQVENEAFMQASTPYANRLIDTLSDRGEVTGILSGYIY